MWNIYELSSEHLEESVFEFSRRCCIHRSNTIKLWNFTMMELMVAVIESFSNRIRVEVIGGRLHASCDISLHQFMCNSARWYGWKRCIIMRSEWFEYIRMSCALFRWVSSIVCPGCERARKSNTIEDTRIAFSPTYTPHWIPSHFMHHRKILIRCIIHNVPLVSHNHQARCMISA